MTDVASLSNIVPIGGKGIPQPSPQQISVKQHERRSSRISDWAPGELKSIQTIPPEKRFEDFYFVGNALSICAQNPSSTRPVLYECLDVPSLKSRIVKVINKSRIPASAGGEKLWRKLCEKLLNLEHHTNVMRILEVLESQEQYYIVMEQMSGGELFDFLLNERAVPEEVCKFVMRQILRSVDHMHSNDLLHRDVKPENLMFRYPKKGAPSSMQQHELALIDFDTCKMLDVPAAEYKEVVNGKRRLVGTYGYLAPEVLKGGEYSRASDMWSIGVILYILMTGVPPLPMDHMNSAKESVEVHRKVEAEGIDFNLSPLPEFPRSRDLCKRLLEWDPRKRLSDIKEALKHPWLQERVPRAIQPAPTQVDPNQVPPTPVKLQPPTPSGGANPPTPSTNSSARSAQDPRFFDSGACTPSTMSSANPSTASLNSTHTPTAHTHTHTHSPPMPQNVYPGHGQRPNSGLTINIQKTGGGLGGGMGGVPQMPLQMPVSPTAGSVTSGGRSPYPSHMDLTPTPHAHGTVHNGQNLSVDARTHSREALTPLTPNVGPMYS